LVGIILEDTEEGDDAKTQLPCIASLFIVAWPEEFAITLSLQPPDEQTWQEDDTTVSLSLGDWTTQQSFSSPWLSTESREVTLTCNVVDANSTSASLQDQISFKVVNKGTPTESFNVSYENHFSCFVVDIKNPTRTFPVGYTDIRDADTFSVDIDNKSDQNIYIPIMFFLRPPANPTGLVPMIWVLDDISDNDYVPSGIPIQTSKNWHYKEMGNYLRAYTILPAKPGSQNVEFRVYYGFYGPFCSASHANLSLVGYQGHTTAGRWEQLAIGCFGETFCFDIEMSLTSQTVTDVRALMVSGKTNWSWTNAGWGGDWLCVYDNLGRKLVLGGLKVGYISQGPCLTEVKYVGHYGSGAEVYVDATVHTMRTNDYARTIQKIRYDFNSTVSFKDVKNSEGSCFFRVGGGAGWEGWFCNKVAIGNADGLLEDIEIPETLQVGDFFISRRKMVGPGPWFIAIPESYFKSDQQGMGIAWKSLIIRSFKSEIDGVIRLAPKVTLYVRQSHGDGSYYVDALISTNDNIFELNPGDKISLDVEWITLPYNAESYYGDNTVFRQHLQENPQSWTTAFREAMGNNLSASVEGGNVISTFTYPLVISVADPMIRLEITGGVGAVPVRFEGLSSKNYSLVDDTQPDTIVEWYDTLFCPESQTYSMTFNLPLDDRPKSSWTFQRFDSA
jgi:hypothetical protein